MPCYKPLRAWYSKERNPKTGKRSLVFDLRNAISPKPIQIACGQCIGCRLKYSKEWAIRCVNEASLYGTRNCFITLTYNDKYLPESGSLNKRHFQLFMKRLRKKFPNTYIKYYMCGEYGELCLICKLNHKNCTCKTFIPSIGRPHFHACLFNHQFPHKYHYTTRNGVALYRSPALEQLWSDPKTKEPYGYATVGDVTFNSAAYVARYIMKKVTGKNSESYYNGKQPAYTCMSRREAIGKKWIEKYLDDVYPNDQIILNKLKCKPPRYYDDIYDLHYPEQYAKLKAQRKKFMENNEKYSTHRLSASYKIKKQKIKQLIRHSDI